jgi:hypothetical protein
VNRAGLALAWSLSALFLVLEATDAGRLGLEGASRLGVVLGLWIALAGLPGTDRERGVARRVAWTLALAAPPLGLAFGLDRAEGLLGEGLGAGAATAVVGLLLVALVAGAAAAPAGVARARTVHAAGWTLWIPGIAALFTALSWAPRTGAGAARAELLPAAVRALDPLLWIGSWASAGGAPGPAWRAGIGALVVGVLLFALTAASARGTGDGDDAGDTGESGGEEEVR